MLFISLIFMGLTSSTKAGGDEDLKHSVCPLLAPLISSVDVKLDPEIDTEVFRQLRLSLPTLFKHFLFEYKPSPVGTLPFEMAAHKYLRRLEEGSVLSARDAVIKGHVLDELVVVTHQTNTLQPKTALTLKSDRFLNTPRLVIVSPGFPAHDDNFAKSATLLTISHFGHVHHQSIAKTVFFAGGLASECLKSTADSILRNAKTARLTHLRFVFLSDLIYPSEGNESLAYSVLGYRFLRNAPYEKKSDNNGNFRLDFDLTEQYGLHLQADIQSSEWVQH